MVRTWLVLLLVLLVLLIVAAAKPQPQTMFTAERKTKDGSCQPKCGNIWIPYPFGVGRGTGCSKNLHYDILCISEKAYLPWAVFNLTEQSNHTMIQIVNITETKIWLKNQVAYQCFNTTAKLNSSGPLVLTVDRDSPYSISETVNQLTVVGIGCDESNMFLSEGGISACLNNCSGSGSEGPSDGCDGVGCCQAFIRKGKWSYELKFDQQTNPGTEVSSLNESCAFIFLGKNDPRFEFHGAVDLVYPDFVGRVEESISLALDWVIAPGSTCDSAAHDRASYPCQNNTKCSNDTDAGIQGYHCVCKEGYQGNPYLGCEDVDECSDHSTCPLLLNCINTAGGHRCDYMNLSLGLVGGTIFILFAIFALRKRKLKNMKLHFYKLNGGLLLNQLILPGARDNMDLIKVFSIEDLQFATKNFCEGKVIGVGGYGTVYKGILPNNQVVAIKRSKYVDQSQIEQFINELVILSRLEHQNVVRLLGCCLEVEVPLLVYEFISNGMLYDHIHNKNGLHRYSWPSCLRIASESADAIAYLHSILIIHRDIKSSNILLDESYKVKVSDFGASRLFPLNQTHVSTMVQGTLGYLDPEYYMSGQLTEKSDVFSFGVVLAELLTRKGPLSPGYDVDARKYNLATHFVKSMRDGKLLEIVDSQLVEQVSKEELVLIAKLVRKCLSVKGDGRPTMKEVAMELQQLSDQFK